MNNNETDELYSQIDNGKLRGFVKVGEYEFPYLIKPNGAKIIVCPRKHWDLLEDFCYNHRDWMFFLI